jgi:hypothetical protein
MRGSTHIKNNTNRGIIGVRYILTIHFTHEKFTTGTIAKFSSNTVILVRVIKRNVELSTEEAVLE